MQSVLSFSSNLMLSPSVIYLDVLLILGCIHLDLSFITPFILISRLIQEQKRKHESLSVNPSVVHNMTWDKYYNFDEVKHMNRFF